MPCRAAALPGSEGRADSTQRPEMGAGSRQSEPSGGGWRPLRAVHSWFFLIFLPAIGTVRRTTHCPDAPEKSSPVSLGWMRALPLFSWKRTNLLACHAKSVLNTCRPSLLQFRIARVQKAHVGYEDMKRSSIGFATKSGYETRSGQDHSRRLARALRFWSDIDLYA